MHRKNALPVLLFLAGCAAGPDYAPPLPATPAAWSRLDPRHAESGRQDIVSWWRKFDDPLLAAFVEEALAAHPDITSARARLRQARAQAMAATGSRWPEVSVLLQTNRSDGSSQTSSGAVRTLYRAGLDAAWEVDVFGGVRRSIEAAEADVEAAQATLAATQVSLAAETALAYVDARSQQARLVIAHDNLARQTETLELTDWRARAGLVSSQDVEQARANVEQTRAQIPLLEQNLAAAEDRLALLTAQPVYAVRERLAGGGRLPAPPERIAVAIPADTLRQRPDVAAAERQLAAATARVGAAEAARYPRFTLSGTLGVEALAASALGDAGSGFSTLAAQVLAPLFDAGKRQAQVEVQDALREQAAAQYRKVVLTALAEVEDTLAALAGSRAREASLARAAEAVRNAALLARQRYQAGLIDFQSVLDTERSRLAVEDQLATVRAERLATLIRLFKAMGGGWPQPERGSHP